MKSFRHTQDNQLTGIYWNSSKATLGGNIENCWTVLWVRVVKCCSLGETEGLYHDTHPCG